MIMMLNGVDEAAPALYPQTVLGHTDHVKEPGTFSMLTPMSGESPLIEVMDGLAEKGHDAFVDETGLGALFLRADIDRPTLRCVDAGDVVVLRSDRRTDLRPDQRVDAQHGRP
jgi:hypothetical protein